MANKFAEKLLILKEHGNILLERLYNIKQIMNSPKEKPLVFQDDKQIKLKKIFDLLGKNFPNFNENIDGQSGYEIIKENLRTLVDQLSPIYYTFKGILEFMETAKKEIEDICTVANIDLQIHLNFVTVSDFFSVLILYAKIVLLINRIEQRKILLSFYNLCYSKLNGQPDGSVQKVAKMITSFQNPCSVLQSAFLKARDHVGTCLIHIWNWIEGYDYGILTKNRPLEMLSDPEKIPFPSIEPIYNYLILHQTLIEWIFFGYLCCPDALGIAHPTDKIVVLQKNQKVNKEKKGIDLLSKILSENYVIAIYADEKLFVHEYFEEIFPKFKGQLINLTKSKKYLKDSEDVSTKSSHQVHRDKRNYLLIHLKTLLYMIQDNSGLVGPKFNLILGALQVAKEEILWYVNHVETVPKYRNNNFAPIKEENFGEILFYCDGIFRHCFKNLSVIQKYYLDMIHKLYAKKFGKILQPFLSLANFDKDNNVVNMFNSFENDINNANSYKIFRLNYRRSCIFLMSFNFKNVFKEGAFISMFDVLNKVFSFSRYVDDLENVLIEYGSLKQLYFYKDIIDKIFTESINGTNTQPLFSLSFIRVMQYFPDNVNKNLNPQLRERIGKDSVENAEKKLQEMSNVIEKIVADLRGKNGYGILMKQLGGKQTAFRIKQQKLVQQQQQIINSGKKVKNLIVETPKPGNESEFKNREMIKKLIALERNLSQLLFGICKFEELQIFDTIFYPTEFVRNKLEDYIDQYVRKVAHYKLEEANNKDALQCQFLPPSEITKYLQTFMMVLKLIEQCININTEEIVLTSFLDEFVHHDQLLSPYESNASGEKPNAVVKYAHWYGELLLQISKLKILYDPLRKSFVSTNLTPIQGYKVEEYLCIEELRALASLVGPLGIRTIDQLICKELSTLVQKLKEILVQFQQPLKEIEEKFFVLSNNNQLIDFVNKKVKGIEKILSLSIDIGAILQFRDLLKEALEYIQKQRCPLIFDLVKNINNQYPFNYFKDPKYLPLDALTTDCGINKVDMSLIKVISPIVEKDFEYFPIAISLLLTQVQQLNNFSYDINLEGWSGNLHLSIETFYQLLPIVFYAKGNLDQIIDKFELLSKYINNILLNIQVSNGINQMQKMNCFLYADKILKKFSNFISVDNDCPYYFTKNYYMLIYQMQKNIKVEE